MTPEQLCKSGSEHSHQVALFAWVAVAACNGIAAADAWSSTGIITRSSPEPALRWFHAIHNQGHGDKIRGANAKAEGVRKGVADTLLPVKRGVWPGLYIEMKKPSEKPKKATSLGGLSVEQIEFKNFVMEQGYGWIVCYTWREAADTLTAYLKQG